MMKVDMSPEAVTGRMKMLDQLWELSVALKSSAIVKHQADSTEHVDPADVEKPSVSEDSSSKDNSF
jgi:hypothetical protein